MRSTTLTVDVSQMDHHLTGVGLVGGSIGALYLPPPCAPRIGMPSTR
jgi:hypothetical protein